MMTKSKLNRRQFLNRSSVSILGAGLVGTGVAKAIEANSDSMPDSKVAGYRTLGRTGFKVSDISSGSPSNEAVLKALLDRGVNLIDTGEVYGNGNSERLIGKVIGDYDRSKLFINTKLYEAEAFPDVDKVIERTNQCLERLQTNYVDCMMIHSAETSQILKDENFHKAMDILKKDGKVKSVGVSCHGSNWAYDTKENMEKILMAAIEDGRFDVILLAYNFVNAEMAERIIQACAQANVGTIIMKSNPVHIFGLLENRIQKLQEKEQEIDAHTQAFHDKYKAMNEQAAEFFKEYITEETDLSAAASKYVLANQDAHTTIWDFRNFEDVQHMLQLSGTSLSKNEDLALSGYKKHFGKLTCRLGCHECESVCPSQLPINKILRYNYYYEVKAQEKRAMQKFAKAIEKKPSQTCTGCDAPCEQICPYQVETRSLLVAAQQNLEMV